MWSFFLGVRIWDSLPSLIVLVRTRGRIENDAASFIASPREASSWFNELQQRFDSLVRNDMSELVRIMAEHHDLEISQDEASKLEWYLDRLIEKNESINLTRITNKEDALILHLEDSLTALPFLNAAPEGIYADLGTGGGIPGVPLAICSGRKSLLVDSVRKKLHAIDEMISDYEQGNIETYAGRIEELALERRNGFAVVTARALTKLVSLIELASPLLFTGGLLICFKARIDGEEMNDAEAALKLVGMKLLEVKEFSLSNGDSRSLIVFKKIGGASIRLPRRNGLAQHSPLA